MWTRSKKFQKQLKETDHFFEIPKHIPMLWTLSSKCYVSPSLWEDLSIESWASSISNQPNVQDCLKAYLTHPIQEVNELRNRQKALQSLKRSKPFMYSKEPWYWLLSLPESPKNYLLNTLFPNAYPMKLLTLDTRVLTLYQYYRSYVSPLVQCVYPLSILLGPFFYVRKTFGWKVSLREYFRLLIQGIQWLYRNLKVEMKSVAMLLVYVAIYLYSLILSIDFSYQLHHYRSLIQARMKALTQTVKRFQSILKKTPMDFWKPFGLSMERSSLMNTPSDSFYTLWKHPEQRTWWKNIFKVMTLYETLQSFSQILPSGCFPSYNLSQSTYLCEMKHPLLKKAVPNPIYLKKHLIITGPNAGGKTTYVKSFLWNLLLGQTWGWTFASSANLSIYDAFLHHDRIKDMVGSKSLFEAEMEKAKEVLAITHQYTRPIYFMDEPFHSTPPLEGAAMLKAFLLYLAKETPCKVLITTHYFSIQSLEQEAASLFRNVSVEGKQQSNGSFDFDYRLRKGPSIQSIGIELLKTHEFPSELIQTAIKFKNKISFPLVNV